MMHAAALVASMLAITGPALDSEIRAVAALPGEPRIVSAAGVRKDDTPVLTLENPDAFDPGSTKRRVVVYSSGASDAATAAVVAMVRWFKSAAPQQLRDEWVVSALPAATFDAADTTSMTRWMTFQAPDVLVEVTDRAAPLVGPGDVSGQNWVIDVAGGPAALGSTLRSAKSGRSAARDTILARVKRDPLDIARVLARRYPETPAISYIPAIAWLQTLRLADVIKDDALRDKVRQQTRPWIAGEKPLWGDRVQLTTVAGTMIFAELATGTAGDREAARTLADQGVAAAAKEKAPAVPEYGQGWTDDMFMATAVLARSGARPGHDADRDAAVRLLIDYASRLQRTDGLFNHAADAPVAWGRGNGFAAFGLLEVLSRLPESHASRSKLLEILRRQMAAVRGHQAPDGAFRQILDEAGAYREETATAMLLTVMARGVRLGWLDGSYRATIERAWRALAAHVADDGAVIDVCAGTGAGSTRRYYFDRPAVTGADDRGGAMALLASMEMHDLVNAQAR
jgi:unsaturated rhamnogalacturonyl hydrolase